MAMPFEIRRAGPADAPGLAAVHVRSWHEALVAVDASEAIGGFALSRPFPLPASAEPGSAVAWSEPEYDVVLTGLYVIASAQRLGVGRALLRETALLQREAGRHSMLLWVVARNAKARAFYEAMGAAFVREDDRQPWGQVIYGWRNLATLL